MDNSYDLIVIGSGPGGYTAAIRGAQLGFHTAIVEKYETLGGTCTNVGCIPSKALLDSTELLEGINLKAAKAGIEVEGVKVDFNRMIERKKQVVKLNTDGLNYLMKKNKITVLRGTASFRDPHSIVLTAPGAEDQVYSSTYFIIATGSKPSTIPGVTIDKKRIISSTEALSLTIKPSSLIVIGGGVIGVELASVYQRIGVKVTIVEYSDRLLPAMDKELGKELEKLLKRKGIGIFTSSKVLSATANEESVDVSYLDKEGKTITLNGEYCLVAVGRKPYTTGLGLSNTRILTDQAGRVMVDDKLQTAEENIYAIGDVIRGVMLAHKAEDEAVMVLDNLKGMKHPINYLRIPNVVYTWPEVAGVGYTEDELIAAGTPYNKGKFPFIASAKARAADDTDGFLKVLTDPKYGEVLGVQIISARAADLIAQAVLSMDFEITDNELAKISYAHPTFSEAFKDAYLISSGRGAINL
ncbi:MAG: dihydrolipoyl dehydrogenase [Chitinophagaceae bacterium]